MRYIISIAMSLFFVTASLMGQDAMDSKTAMKKLEFLEGQWKGKAIAMTGPGQREEVEQYEEVEYRLDGRILLIEGKGYQAEDLVFNALAILNFNENTQEYEMKSWLKSGEYTEAYFKEVEEGQFEWGFDLPENSGSIRYNLKLNEEGQWVEEGQYSPDGVQWFPTFEMTLDKID